VPIKRYGNRRSSIAWLAIGYAAFLRLELRAFEVLLRESPAAVDFVLARFVPASARLVPVEGAFTSDESSALGGFRTDELGSQVLSVCSLFVHSHKAWFNAAMASNAKSDASSSFSKSSGGGISSRHFS
jgi:hypothetical protein